MRRLHFFLLVKKKILFSLLLLALSTYTNGQKLIKSDSSFSQILSKSLSNHIIDSCIVQVMFAEFSVGKEGEIKNFQCSHGTPIKISELILIELQNLKPRWNKKVIRQFSRTGKHLLLPILAQVMGECTIKESERRMLRGMDIDWVNTPAFNAQMNRYLTKLMAGYLIDLTKTFPNITDLQGKAAEFIDCVLLDPVVMKSKEIPRERM
jgi:hypothetical protein